MTYRPPHRQGTRGKERARAQPTTKDERKRVEMKQNLDWLPSVSRSGGLDDDGDTLKDYKVQETYRAWIDEKLLEYEKRECSDLNDKYLLEREDIIRRFRKLREGIMAANRDDEFTTEVYETSLFLASAYKTVDQVTAVAAQILPLTMVDIPPFLRRSEKGPSRRLPSEIVLFHILLHHVVLSTRSSLSLRWIIEAISHPTIAAKLSPQRLQWLKHLRIRLKSLNYQLILSMTEKKAIDALISDIVDTGAKGARQSAGIIAEVEALRIHVRNEAWKVVRSTYREESEAWLCTCLALPSPASIWLGEKEKIQEALLVSEERPRWRVFKPKAPA